MQQNLCYNCFTEQQNPDITCTHCGYNNAVNRARYPIALEAGSILDGRYIVGRVLGQGGFGITYLALDHSLNIKVAIKEYLPDSMATRMPGTTLVTTYSGDKQEHFNYGSERFLDEARTLAKFIGNKNIAAVKSYFNENNTAYFVMDYIEGISFKNYIANKGGKVDYRDALRILSPVMDALAAVHREGFIHRDVTPDNIYITKDDEIKLLDFGSARYSLGDKSKSLDVVLKAGYAPKEQYLRRGKQGPYTDIYSLSACFYASITGFLPPESLERLEDDNLVDISVRGIKIPDALEEAIYKGLELKAEDRFQSMEEFKAAITDVGVPTIPVSSVLPSMPEPESIEAINAVTDTVQHKALQIEEAISETDQFEAISVKGTIIETLSDESEVSKAISSENIVSAPMVLESTVSENISLNEKKMNPLVIWILKNKTVTAAILGVLVIALVFFVVKGISSGKTADEDIPSVVKPVTETPFANNPTLTVEPFGESEKKGLSNPTITIGGQIIDTGVTSLDLSCCGITDISDLVELTNLNQLVLYSNEINDISMLSKLSNLEWLELANNNISDISVLAELTNLKVLTLGDNPLNDINALAELTNLEELDLYNSNISDINVLTNLINLSNLDLSYNEISDISNLSYLKNLKNLSLSGNYLTRKQVDELQKVLPECVITADELMADEDESTPTSVLTPTSVPTAAPTPEPTVTPKPAVTPKLTATPTPKPTATPTTAPGKASTITIGGKTVDINVTSLELNECNITDISELAKLTNLKTLELDNNKISDISALAKLTNLTELMLAKNNISDISALANLTNLTFLDLDSNNITDISALSKLIKLKKLFLGYNNNISDISALGKLTNLSVLFLTKNKISDISTLEKLTNLATLSLEMNKISDIGALAKLTKLEWLFLGGNSISDISTLTKLSNLTQLTLYDNPLKQKQVDELQKALPKCYIYGIISASNEPYTFKTSNFTVTGTYTGEWKDGKPNGEGTMTMNQNNDYWSVGDTLYSKYWVDGLIQGYGEFVGTGNNKGYSYKGNFKDGLKDGQGTMNGPNGEVWSGTWSKGSFIG